MSMFGNLTTQGVEEAQDRIGGNFAPEPADIYDATVKFAYVGTSQGGSKSVTVHLDVNGKEIRDTQWVTSAKSGDNTYTDKNGKKQFLGGFTQINDLLLVTSGGTIQLMNAAVEDKVLKLYDYEARGEVNKSVPVLTELTGAKVKIALALHKVDKTKKNEATGNYDPTGETREENVVEKYMEVESSMTVNELKNKFEAPVYAPKWLEKNKGQVIDRSTKGGPANGGQNGRPAAAPPQAGGTAAPRASLFGS